MEGIWKARRHSALRFDRIDDYCNCGSDESLNITDAITIEAWVKPNDVSSAKPDTIYGDADGWDNGSVLRLDNDGRVFLFHNTGNDSYNGGAGTVGNEWTHIAGTFENGVIHIYINGVQHTPSVNHYPGYYRSFVGGRVSRLGNYPEGYNFNGLIASVRIYNRALSEAEIKYLYYNPDDPLDTDHLVLWLHPGSIDTDAGYWWDLSGHDNHGQIFGATKVSLVSPEVTVL